LGLQSIVLDQIPKGRDKEQNLGVSTTFFIFFWERLTAASPKEQTAGLIEGNKYMACSGVSPVVEMRFE
jgi:hypothetical protein